MYREDFRLQCSESSKSRVSNRSEANGHCNVRYLQNQIRKKQREATDAQRRQFLAETQLKHQGLQTACLEQELSNLTKRIKKSPSKLNFIDQSLLEKKVNYLQNLEAKKTEVLSENCKLKEKLTSIQGGFAEFKTEISSSLEQLEDRKKQLETNSAETINLQKRITEVKSKILLCKQNLQAKEAQVQEISQKLCQTSNKQFSVLKVPSVFPAQVSSKSYLVQSSFKSTPLIASSFEPKQKPTLELEQLNKPLTYTLMLKPQTNCFDVFAEPEIQKLEFKLQRTKKLDILQVEFSHRNTYQILRHFPVPIKFQEKTPPVIKPKRRIPPKKINIAAETDDFFSEMLREAQNN